MDQPQEHTCRDIREGILYTRDGPPGIEGPPGAQGEWLEWQAPILPAGQGIIPVNETGRSRPGGPDAFVEAERIIVQCQEESPRDSHSGSTAVFLWAVPVISVVSISTVIARRFWNKRQRLCRMGL